MKTPKAKSRKTCCNKCKAKKIAVSRAASATVAWRNGRTSKLDAEMLSQLLAAQAAAMDIDGHYIGKLLDVCEIFQAFRLFAYVAIRETARSSKTRNMASNVVKMVQLRAERLSNFFYLLAESEDTGEDIWNDLSKAERRRLISYATDLIALVGALETQQEAFEELLHVSGRFLDLSRRKDKGRETAS
jgi:hypothetical protein